MARRRHSPGFTLVELLVALFVLSLVALLSWRGLDGMVRTQEVTQRRADEVQALQAGLAQWAADLDAMVSLPQLPALDWNGRVLRLTRESSAAANEGVVVVGWSRRVRDGVPRWTRWRSPPLTTRGQLEEAWARADAWAQNQAGTDDASAVAITPLEDWQVFYYRSDAWTNPLSSDATQPEAASGPAPVTRGALQQPRVAQIPDGIRIVLRLPAGQAITGELTRDWVRPTVGGRKS